MQLKKITDINGRDTYKVDDARIMFRNFAGAEGRYNQKGRRNFCLQLDDESSKLLEDDGFNVKVLEPRDEDGTPIHYIKVNVNMDSVRPPIIQYKNNHGIMDLDENTIIKLDDASFRELHIEFNAYRRTDEATRITTTTAYVSKILAVIEEDEFESRFYDTPDSAANTMTFAQVSKKDE